MNRPPTSTLALQQAFAEFAASTEQLARQDEELRQAVELLRQDLAQTHSRLHEEMHRRASSEAQLGSMFASAPFGLIALAAGRVTGFNQAAAALFPDLAENAQWVLPIEWRRRGSSDEYLTERGNEARLIRVNLVKDAISGTECMRIDDITDMHRERENLERQERLASMGRLSAELAHQLRTPLCTATLYASQLREADIGAAERCAMADRLIGQLGQLDSLITRMLSFVKTRARAQEIGPIAKPRQILVVPELPKTRSGKIMRRLLRDVAENRSMGDVTTLADPTVMNLIGQGLSSASANED